MKRWCLGISISAAERHVGTHMMSKDSLCPSSFVPLLGVSL